MTDRFGVKRNVCACGEIAYVWDGKKSVCFKCHKPNVSTEVAQWFDKGGK